MKIVFSDHSKKQGLVRKITRKQVLETINNPEKKLRSFRSRRLLQGKFGAKILEVVIIKEKDVITVITQYWLEDK